MQDGTLHCPDCGHLVDPETFTKTRNQYAARYSAPGYLDCTEWEYGANKRELLRRVRSIYA